MKKLIVLIDDDNDEEEIFSQALLLRKPMSEFIFIQGLEKQLGRLKTLSPDYIFIDMNMPGIDGLTGIKLIKETTELAEVPVILYSTTINEALSGSAKKAGAFFCLEKSENVTKLADSLEQIFKSA